MRTVTLLILIGFFTIQAVFSQDERETFTIEKELKHTPVISQGSTGTCWSFATTSFLESEIMRKGFPETNLSEMFFVNYAYLNKAKSFLMYHGKANFSQGGLSHDVLKIIREHGMATHAAFPGILENGKYRHTVFVSDLTRTLNKISSAPRKEFCFKTSEALDTILTKHLGQLPKKIKLKGKDSKPVDFPARVNLNPDDYVELTSFNHHAYYKQFVLEIPDNWSHALYYNLPVNELIEVMYNSINNGYSIAWDGDTSEKLFQHGKGKADLPVELIGKVDQELRQKTFLNRTTTDDHLMHIVGLSKDSSGRDCFYTKNSWGAESNKYGGFLHMTVDYVRLKTVGILVHKDAIPENIKVKLGL